MAVFFYFLLLFNVFGLEMHLRCLFVQNVFIGLGGQRLLAVDIPGPSAAEEQQGTLLPAAVEAPSTLSPVSRGNKGGMGSDAGSLSLVCQLPLE